MAIIDPDGLFGGKRLLRCSDRARLLWPYLFLASNGYGRIELDWQQITYEVFRGFRKPFKESELAEAFGEYRAHHLIFVYKHGSQTWGQWWCKPGSLPRWKTAKDGKSPEPPKDDYDSWVKYYGTDSEPLPKSAEDLKTFPLGIGEGVGVGVGDGKATTLPPSGGGWRDQTFDEFWDGVWFKTGKDAAKNVWDRKVKSEDQAAKIITASKAQGPDIMAAAHERARREKSKLRPLHPATWLNQGRYEDEDIATKPDGGICGKCSEPLLLCACNYSPYGH